MLVAQAKGQREKTQLRRAGKKSRGWSHGLVGSWALTGVENQPTCAYGEVEGGNLPILAVGTDFHPVEKISRPTCRPVSAATQVLTSATAVVLQPLRIDSTALQGFSFLNAARLLVSLIAATTDNSHFCNGRLLPPTRTQTFAKEFVKPAIDVDTLTRRNSARQRSPCHPPASPSTLAWPRTTITESQIRAGCTRPDHHHRTLSPIPHPSPPRLPYRQLLTLGATTAVAQTDMFEPETDLPRSLSAVTELQSWASQQHRPPPSCRRPAPRLGHASGPCRAAAGWRHNPHSITLRFQFPSPNIHDAELERRRAGECRC